MRRARRLLRAIVLALLVVGACLPAIATAEAPTITIGSPLDGSATNSQTSTFSGATNDLSDEVALFIYNGAGVAGIPAQTLTTFPLLEETWSVGPTGALPDGTYTAQAIQTNLLLETGISEPVTFTVDTLAPSVSLSAVPSPSNDATPSFSGKVGVVPGDLAPVDLKIYAGSVASGSPVRAVEVTSSGGSWATGAVAKLGDGTYTARAEQSDEAGNVGLSVPSTFRVDTTAPDVVLSAPVSGSLTNSESELVEGSAGTAEGDSHSVTVELFAGSSIGAQSPEETVTVQASNGHWSTSFGGLSDGTYTVRAEQSDSAGNSAKSESATFTVDTLAPSVSLSAVPSPSNDATPSFSGKAGVAPGDLAPVNLKIYAGSVASGSPVQTMKVTSAGGSWTTGAVSKLGDGTYTVQAEQSDEAGNVGLSAPATFRVDTTPPHVVLSAPVSGSLTNSESELVEGSAGTAEGDSHSVTVELFAGSSIGAQSPQETIVAQVSGGHWSASFGGLSDGPYTVRAEQSDSAGNSAKSEPATFTVDTHAPAVSLAAVASPSNDSTPSFGGGAGVAPLDIPSVTLRIYAGTVVSGSPVQSVKVASSGGSWTTGAVAKLADGTYTAQVEQSDEAGNAGLSLPSTFTIDTKGPAVTLTQISHPFATSTPSFSGGAGVAAGDIGPVRLKIYSGGAASGSPVRTLEVTPNGASWTAGPVASLNDGTYTAQAEQSDDAHNVTLSTPATFRVDTTPPHIALSAPVNGSLTNSESEPIEGSAGTAEGDSPSITIELFAGSTIGAHQSPEETVTVQASSGHWSATLGGLSERTYTVRAEQSDEAGNSAQSAPATFTVDKTTPIVSLAAVASPSSDSTPSFSGKAGVASGDHHTVTLKIYQGTVASGSPVETAHATVNAGAWTAGPILPLADGTYTARAEQSNTVGNIGLSAPVTFTILTPVPVISTEPTLTTPAPAPADSPPAASFTWFPSTPNTGENVTLVSNSTDASSPIVGLAWSLTADGNFQADASELTTSFGTPGNHVVRLRVTGADGLSSIATETIPVSSPHLSLMQPFPIVRIAGTDTATGVKLRLLTVQAPSGARITVSCRGHGCPLKTQSRSAASSRTGVVVVEFRRFEHALRAGTIVEIRVSKSGQIGKYTRFQIRRGKLPERLDTCLSPVGLKPMACPS